MTGKRYYLTTLGNWKRLAASFANSHWFVVAPAPQEIARVDTQVMRTESPIEVHCLASGIADIPDDARILALIEADEGTHGALEDDNSFEALPHPLSQRPISDAAQSALAAHGVTPGTSTFDATEIISRAHPLLRHRVF
jgi:hypothetical protein